jgi:hypothetical protein
MLAGVGHGDALELELEVLQLVGDERGDLDRLAEVEGVREQKALQGVDARGRPVGLGAEQR